MMSNNTASSPPPEVSCDAWSETEHTVEARVSPELLAMTRQRRKSKQDSRKGDLFETGKTVEHRIPDDLLEMVRGRRNSSDPRPGSELSAASSAPTPSGPGAADDQASASTPLAARVPLEWNGPSESQRMEISQVRVRPRTPPEGTSIETEQSELSPALVFAVVAWAGLLAYCAFLGAGL